MMFPLRILIFLFWHLWAVPLRKPTRAKFLIK
jgi:hypothetical protein